MKSKLETSNAQMKAIENMFMLFYNSTKYQRKPPKTTTAAKAVPLQQQQQQQQQLQLCQK